MVILQRQFIVLGLVLQVLPALGAVVTQNVSSITTARGKRSTSRPTTDYARQICNGCNDGGFGICSRKTLMRIKRYSDDLKCRPEPTLVKLKLPGPDYSVEPNVAKVNRCDGYCRVTHESCLPTETSFVKIPVMLIHHGSGSPKCVEYEIEQHEACACGCEVLRDYCSDKHIHEHCSCKCKNQVEKSRCLEDESLFKTVWDEENCDCVCQPEKCPRGYTWDYLDCRCEAMSKDEADNLLY